VPRFTHYRQFEALSEEEVNVAKREVAAERRAAELARVEPLDLARTTWPEYPPPVIVNAITFAARKGLHRYIDRHATSLRARPAAEKAAIVAAVLAGVWPAVAAGEVKPVIDRVLPLSEVAEAHRLMESSTHVGKIVLRI